jgi:hypothetical protein
MIGKTRKLFPTGRKRFVREIIAGKWRPGRMKNRYFQV